MLYSVEVKDINNRQQYTIIMFNKIQIYCKYRFQHQPYEKDNCVQFYNLYPMKIM